MVFHVPHPRFLLSFVPFNAMMLLQRRGVVAPSNILGTECGERERVAEAQSSDGT